MDTTRLKSNKVIGLAGAALAIVSLGFATSTTVKADNAQMQDLPKGIKAAGAKIPGQYGFRPKVMKCLGKN